jgi:hypothetical protein
MEKSKNQKKKKLEDLTPEELLAQIKTDEASSGTDEVQGLGNLLSRLLNANKNLNVEHENDITVVKGKGRKGRTGSKNPAGRESNES